MLYRLNRCTLWVLVLSLLGLGMQFLPAQDAKETDSSVAELEAFHDVIYPIWHTAYPDKDVKALRGFVGQINELAAKIYTVKLPGILRDKDAKWKTGVEQLKAAVESYNSAAKGTDEQALLKAAEGLHARYEMLVRTIRPVHADVDAFHKILYVVYHDYLPGKKYEEIKKAAPQLTAKAETAAKATLSKRLAAKQADYQKAVTALLEASRQLEATCSQGKTDEILKAAESVHTRYQAVEKVFD